MAAEPAYGAEGAHGAGAENAAGFPPFDLALFPHQLIWFAIAFLTLYYLMSRVALPRVAEVLETRAQTIKGDLDAAAATSAAADKAKTDAERATAEARAGARKIVDDMRAEMAASLAADRAKADETLAAQAAAAEKRILDQRTTALSGVGAMADDLAREIVTKLSGARA
jgi:F-type H+-transporting ATPase subunit b